MKMTEGHLSSGKVIFFLARRLQQAKINGDPRRHAKGLFGVGAITSRCWEKTPRSSRGRPERAAEIEASLTPKNPFSLPFLTPS